MSKYDFSFMPDMALVVMQRELRENPEDKEILDAVLKELKK